MQYTFNDKETYLVAAAAWKADYNKLSQDIRVARTDFNNAQKAFAKSSAKEGTYWNAWKEVERLRSHRESLRSQANYLLNDRFTMKEEACRQYEANKQPA